MSNELKPCAHCGGEAECSQWFTAYVSGKYATSCESCGILTAFYDTKAEAIQAWNARANNRTKRTCKMEEAYCSECGRPDPSSGDARFCAYCGARVVS